MRILPAILLLVAAPIPASADLTAGLDLEGWYGKAGVETGVAFARDRGTSPLLGGVATLVHLNDDLEWVGVQADLLADWNGDRSTGARWSFGPEAGVALFGVDVGYFGERVDGRTHHGGQLRAKLTVGLAAIYIRGAYAHDAGAAVDAGLQLKAPVWIRRPKRGPAQAVARR